MSKPSTSKEDSKRENYRKKEKENINYKIRY